MEISRCVSSKTENEGRKSEEGRNEEEYEDGRIVNWRVAKNVARVSNVSYLDSNNSHLYVQLERRETEESFIHTSRCTWKVRTIRKMKKKQDGMEEKTWKEEMKKNAGKEKGEERKEFTTQSGKKISVMLYVNYLRFFKRHSLLGVLEM